MDISIPKNLPNIEAMDQLRHTLLDMALRYGPRLLTAFIILMIGFLAARRMSSLSARWLQRKELEPPVQKLLSRMIGLFVLIIFLMMALQNLGVELFPLLASLGVVGVGAGLAMQGVLSNLVAGLTILFTQPFRVGEYISVIGVRGEVETIDLFSTILVHGDRSRVVIPNRKLVGEVMHNYGKIRQLDLSIGVAYSTDLDRATAAMRAVLSRNPRVLTDPTPSVGVTKLNDSTINISVQPWVKVPDYDPATNELYQAIVETCREQRIDLAFPQREIRILQGSVPGSN